MEQCRPYNKGKLNEQLIYLDRRTVTKVSKNLLTGSFRNFSKKRFKENCYQKSIEQIANFAKIEKVTKIFLASEKIE